MQQSGVLCNGLRHLDLGPSLSDLKLEQCNDEAAVGFPSQERRMNY